MTDTGFWVSPERQERLAVGYGRGIDRALIVHDMLRSGHWSKPPVFPAGGGGLVSTLDDKHLYVFQRTPSTIGVRGNHPIDVEWYKSLPSGWQAQRRSLFLDAASSRADDAEVRDGWTETGRILRASKPAHDETPEEIGKRALLADIEIMNRRRQRIDENVTDPDMAEKLKPLYNLFCKRPTFNDDILATINRPNVTLIGVAGDDAISGITTGGIVAGGREYEVDLIVYASGFQVVGSVGQRISFPIIGRNGVRRPITGATACARCMGSP